MVDDDLLTCPKCGGSVVIHPPTNQHACRNPECAYVFHPDELLAKHMPNSVTILLGIRSRKLGAADECDKRISVGATLAVAKDPANPLLGLWRPDCLNPNVLEQ